MFVISEIFFASAKKNHNAYCFGDSFVTNVIFLWVVVRRNVTVLGLVVLLAVDSAASRSVVQVLACGLVTCVLNWCKTMLNA